MKVFLLSTFLCLSAVFINASNPPKRIIEILNSGDGKSAKTAYKVYTIQEEYDLMEYLKIIPHKQLISFIDEQHYDILMLGEKQFYFQLIPKPKIPNV